MSTTWACLGIAPLVDPCGAHGDTTAAAERHIADTGHATGPATTCWITVWRNQPNARPRPCGQPAVEGALCARHAADRDRLKEQP